MDDSEKLDIPQPPNLGKTELHRIYDSIWRNMDRENNLINQRVGWSIFFSAGLFAAATLCVTTMLKLVELSGNSVHWTPVTQNLSLVSGCLVLFLLSSLGAYFAQRVLHGVEAALAQLEYLRGKYERDEAKFKAMGLPRPFGEKRGADRGRSASIIFPQTVMLIWLSGAGLCLVALGIAISGLEAALQ